MVSKLLPRPHRRQTPGIITLSAHAWSLITLLDKTKQKLIPASIYTVSRPSFLSTLNIRFNDELMIYCVNLFWEIWHRVRPFETTDPKKWCYHHLIEQSTWQLSWHSSLIFYSSETEILLLLSGAGHVTSRARRVAWQRNVTERQQQHCHCH